MRRNTFQRRAGTPEPPAPRFDFDIARRPEYYRRVAQMHSNRLRERGATLLRLSRINGGGHLRLHAVCASGHEFAIAAKHLELDHWCGQCRDAAQASARQAILEELAVLARRRGYRLISARYYNARKPLRWECDDGHRWSTNADNFKNKQSGCPECHLIALFSARDQAHKRRRRWRGAAGVVPSLS